jgi:UDP-N-acetylglucosamine--N-acetylmuramyl-(pentapeptide) pyrophosphoryl-undecaprenol N-acetylglucosamine transferase
MRNSMRWVIAGGGTGGHLFPGMAIAEAFVGREVGNEVLFIGTGRGVEVKVLAGGKFPLKTISARPLKGISFLGKVKAILSIPRAISEALSILKDFQPQIVLGVGGYSSGPTLLAAFLLRIKRAIHEQNVVPGMTNRLLRWFCQRIFISFEETEKYFPKGKTIVTGTPVRSEIIKRGEGVRRDRFTILIVGGSRGAHRINEKMMEALTLLMKIKDFVRFFHQTGSGDVDFVSKGYQENGFEASVAPFFEKMAAYYQLSDLVISRAGASTIAELAVCGKAAIFVPYPYAAHNHQLMNAQRLVEMEAAKMIRDKELNGSILAQTILSLYDHPEERAKMEKTIQQLARPKAAEEIVDHCYALLGK